jgi:hypothetical protein
MNLLRKNVQNLHTFTSDVRTNNLTVYWISNEDEDVDSTVYVYSIKLE